MTDSAIKEDFIKSVEGSTGLTRDQIRDMPIGDLRKYFEHKNGKKTVFTQGSIQDDIVEVE